MNYKLKKFLGSCLFEVVEKGFSITLENSNTVDDCKGYFDDESKTFAVAVGNPIDIWGPVFIHEYCHFLQFHEKNGVWQRNQEIFDKVNLWDWLDGEIELSSGDLKTIILATQQLESDCDQKAVGLIIENDLPIDVKRYIRMSNSYIWFYSVIKNKRKWYLKSPYEYPQIVDGMPESFIVEEHFDSPPSDYVKKIEKFCL